MATSTETPAVAIDPSVVVRQSVDEPEGSGTAAIDEVPEEVEEMEESQPEEVEEEEEDERETRAPPMDATETVSK